MDSDLRYKWLEHRILASLQPKREALQSLLENEDNKFVLSKYFLLIKIFFTVCRLILNFN